MQPPLQPFRPGQQPRARLGPVERWLLGIVAAAVILFLLVQARFLLMPLVIAIILYSLTSAVIERIARFRLGRFALPNWLASIAAVAFIAAILLALFGIVSSQINLLLTAAPGFLGRGQEVVADMFTVMGDDVSMAVLGAFRDINIGAWLRSLAGSAGNLLLATVMVILYVGFLFTERPWFDRKLALLFPEPARERRIRSVIVSISRSVHHYLLVKTAVSALTGVVVYVILILFGLDFAETIAILSFLLNFIPNIGPIVATVLPVLVALVQFDSMNWVVGLLLAIGSAQFLLGNILDPMMMGRALQMSTFAIVLSLTLWGAVWGVVGMFLAVPIMVMVMIVCAHLPALRPVAVALSRSGDVLPERRKRGGSSMRVADGQDVDAT